MELLIFDITSEKQESLRMHKLQASEVRQVTVNYGKHYFQLADVNKHTRRITHCSQAA